MGELAWLAVGVAASGLLTGVLAGLFGVGGGGIIVPLLFEVFRILDVPDAVRMQLCIGTSLAIIVPTSLRSYQAHKAKGYVLTDVMRRWTPPAMLGVAVGAALAAVAPADLFKSAFVLIAGLLAVKLMIGGDRWTLADHLPGRRTMLLYGFTIGLASSLMGIGGGSLVTIVLTLHGKSVHNAVATGAGLGVPITFIGTIGYILAGLPHHALLPPFSLGFVSLIGVVLIAPLASWAAPFGARLAHRLPRRRLEVALAIFLLLVSARFLASLMAQHV